VLLDLLGQRGKSEETLAEELAAQLVAMSRKDFRALRELLGRTEGRWPTDTAREERLRELTERACVAVFGGMGRPGQAERYLNDPAYRAGFAAGESARERKCESGACRWALGRAAQVALRDKERELARREEALVVAEKRAASAAAREGVSRGPA